jgi:threonine dehydratase
MSKEPGAVAPTITAIGELRNKLDRWLVRTPMLRCINLEMRLDVDAEIHGKLEFLQQTGTFKPRGALANVLELDDDALARGITAVSAGNHAIAAAFAARAVGASAKVVMIKTASPARIELCRHYGAEVVLAEDVHQAFDLVDRIRDEEGRTFVHPFEGSNVTTGTGTIGLEICEQLAEFDTVIVPIGGGGLCSGIACAVKQLRPDCEVIGVEPEGADSMHRSFAAGRPEKLDSVNTIADSLGAPFALPYSYEICREYVDELVRITDDDMRASMRVLFRDMKLAVEPACAASTAALAGPLRSRCAGKKVVLIFCGSNIDWMTFNSHAGIA